MITELVQDFGRTLIYLIFSEILSAAVLGTDPHTARCRSERLEGATQSPAGVQDPPPCRRGTSKDTAESDLGAIQKRVRQGPEVALTGGAAFSETSPLLKVDRQCLGMRAEAHARRAQSRIGLRKGAMTGQIIDEWRRRTASLPRSFRQTIGVYGLVCCVWGSEECYWQIWSGSPVSRFGRSGVRTSSKRSDRP